MLETAVDGVFVPALEHVEYMKLIEALGLINQARRNGAPEQTFHLVCGFTPLHFATFLVAHLQSRTVGRTVTLRTGLFGDISGNLERMQSDGTSATAGIAVVVEWSDLDPRLGWRAAGGWTASAVPDILHTTSRRLTSLVERLSALAGDGNHVCVAFPTLTIPPVAQTPGALTSALEVGLWQAMADASARLVEQGRVRVVSAQRIDRISSTTARADAASDLASGFPISLAHADLLAQTIAELLLPLTPKKGLVTDLDDTLWRGILGDVGIDGVAFSLEDGAQVHGLYQQMLASLADAGVLLAVASKNDQPLVLEALQRPGMLLSADRLFPVHAHWGPKSTSLGAILKAWNVAPDSVVFVDDNPLELAEVNARFPEVLCLRFPKENPRLVVAFLEQLRDLFGKPKVLDEDRYRLASIRDSAAIHVALEEGVESGDQLLSQLDAELRLEFSVDTHDERALQLINKTNQFNLNGVRYSEQEWTSALAGGNRFKLTASYKDKFGPLGKIAVLLCERENDAVRIDAWVLSCRAFSRRIEYQCLQSLFDIPGASRVRLSYAATERNRPARDFLRQLLGEGPWPDVPEIARDVFQTKGLPTYHTILTTGTELIP